jgi:excinuclease UvrABC ATPase subunit
MHDGYKKTYDSTSGKFIITYDKKVYSMNEDSNYYYLIKINTEQKSKFNKKYFNIISEKFYNNKLNEHYEDSNDVLEKKQNYISKLDKILNDIKIKKKSLNRRVITYQDMPINKRKGGILIVDADTPITQYDYVKKKKK